MLLKNHRPSNELKAQGRSLSPGSKPWAVCQVHEQKPPHITPFPVDSPHCPTAKQSLRSAHSRPAPLLLWECWHLLAVNWPPCLHFHPYYTSFIHSYICYLVHSTPTMCPHPYQTLHTTVKDIVPAFKELTGYPGHRESQQICE